tara:strand:- start:590 stop:1168 length:579 start_codon:yes stop_codon:yes gene_type:complete
MIKVIDDFLSDDVFSMLRDCIHSSVFPWTYVPHSSGLNANQLDRHAIDGGASMMASMIFAWQEKGIDYDNMWNLFLRKHDQHVPFEFPIRMKANLYFNKGKKIQHPKHTDINDNAGNPLPNVITSVFSFTECNGLTVILKKDGTQEEVQSKANRIVFFDSCEHYGITQDDTPIRVILNTNVSTVPPQIVNAR